MKNGRIQISQETEQTTAVTSHEQQVINMVCSGHWNRYRLSVFKLDGKLDMGEVMMRYAAIMKQCEEFHTVYLYRDTENPVRVVLKEAQKTFPVHDISFLNEKKQTFLIKNVMAALARHEINLETDCILQLRGFLLDEHEILIVTADYPYLPVSYGVRNLLCEIFKGMHMNNASAPAIGERDMQKMNERFVNKNLQYWKNLLLPMDKAAAVPGEKLVLANAYGVTRYYGELQTDMVSKIRTYCRNAQIEIEALFLSAWGNILGNYNAQEHPVLAICTGGECMNLFPVKMDRTKQGILGLQDVNTQLKELKKNSGCSQEQLEEELNISFGTYFHMVQEFMKFSVVDALQEEKQAAGTVEEIFSSEDAGIALKVIYQMFGETVGMVYVSKNSIYEQMLQQLHRLFLTELEQMLQEKKTQPVLPPHMDHVQKKEELYEIYQKQVVDALAAVELFDCISREGLHKFAEVCSLQTYLANDVILEEGKECRGLYVVAEGHIEESMIAADGMVKSVRMLNPGEWFGVECLLRRWVGTSTFMIAGKEAKLVYIDSRILKELFRVRPECWIKVLEDENRQKRIYQKLWMME